MTMNGKPHPPGGGPAEDRDVVLDVRDLRTWFRTGGLVARAVDGVTFRVRRGETYALVGESGCGKSVTALSILQLVPKTAGYIDGGSIRFQGRELTGLPPVELRRIRGNGISMIFQEPMTALNPVFTAGEQIAEAVRVHQRTGRAGARARAIDLLGRVGIPEPAARCDEYPHQLSGGMRQRVMIAMALACRPDLLIADEPTTSLDVTIQAQILALIRDLQDELGSATLLITHDMGVVRENAQRVGVMYAGRIVEEAPRERLFTAAAHPYTQLLLRSLPARARRDRPIETIRGMVPRATEFPPGCRFHNRCPFVMDRCRAEAPPRYPAGPEHEAECFLLEPGLSAAAAGAPEPAPFPARERPAQDALRLDVQDLAMHFPVRKGMLQRTVAHVRAVDGVSLRVRPAETVALVGESGCGKTTVGRCIVRLLDPTSGSIRFQSQELVGLSRRAMKPYRRRLQMIFQDPFSSLNPRMMVSDILAEGMATHGLGSSKTDRDQRAAALMQRVGLAPDMLRRYPHEFSGGQRQRIGVARALAVAPELIIADEALSSLDVSVQAQILNLLKDIQSEMGLSYLFITHDLSVVRYLADQVSVMYLGRIVEEGAAELLFAGPLHPYTRALLSAAPQVDTRTGRKRIVLAGDVPSPIHPPPGCHFHPRCPYARDRCRVEYPAREDAPDGRRVRCHFWRSIEPPSP